MHGLRQGGEALRQAIIQVASQLFPGFAPFGGLVDAVLGWVSGSKAPKVEIANLDPIQVAPVQPAVGLASNINAALLAGRGVSLQPGFTVEISYLDGVNDIVAAKIAQHLTDLNYGEGY